jgi:hypothetical protein
MSIAKPRAPRIPHTIHQVWFQGASVVPPKFDGARASWIKHHPPGSGWTIKTWDNDSIERLLHAVAPDFGMEPDALLTWYRTLPKFIFKCDVGRCFILYAEGGVYADMDTLSLQPMDTLLDKSEAAADGMGTDHSFVYCKTINNAVFAASPQHPLFTQAWWPEVYDAISGGRQKMGFMSRVVSKMGPGAEVVSLTGPLMWRRVLDGGFPFGGGMSEDTKRAWGIYRPEHKAFYPKMSDAGRLETLSDAAKAKMAADGSYTYHSQESDWLSGFSMESVYMSMTHTDVRRKVVVSVCLALLMVALIWVSIAIARKHAGGSKGGGMGSTGRRASSNVIAAARSMRASPLLGGLVSYL